jgi:hypothetical protein
VVALVKNAITNELYIKLAASIYNRSPANRKYRDQAHAVWVWFRSTAMIKDTTALVQDGLYDDGVVDFNGKPKKPDTSCDDAAYVWTYTQGVILGALVELSRAMGSEALLDDAAAIAGRALNLKEPDPFKRIVFTSPPEDIGLVREHCEEFKTATAQCACSNTTMPGCHVILPQNDHAAPFKGVFVRNLRELFDERRRVGANTYDWATLLLKQRDTLIRRGKSGTADFGFFWNKNQSPSNFAVQGSAIDALVAAHGLH